MRTLTILELDSGGFILMGGEADVLQASPREGPISVCAELGNTYDYPNNTRTLPGAVRKFFALPDLTSDNT